MLTKVQKEPPIPGALSSGFPRAPGDQPDNNPDYHQDQEHAYPNACFKNASYYFAAIKQKHQEHQEQKRKHLFHMFIV